jgi:putative ABC transport system permease protein
MRELLNDLRYASRSLRKSPGFTASAVATLAVGVGAATAIFGVIHAVFLAPLGLAAEGRLVRLRDFQIAPDGRRELWNTSGRSFTATREQNQVFEIVSAFNGGSGTLPASGQGPAERLSVVGMSDPLSQSLGVSPVWGRDFTPREMELGRDARVIAISDSLASRLLGDGGTSVGRTMVLDGASYTIVGILPRRFRFPYDADVWMPARIQPTDEPAVFARLRPGVSVERARSDLATIAARLKAQNREIARGFGMEAIPVRASLIENEERIAVALFAVIALFLVLSCANLASLLLARAVTRRQNAAIRVALGAGPAREIRTAGSEALLIGLAGGVAGFCASGWLSPLLSSLIPDNLRGQLGIEAPSLDPVLFAFALALSAAAGLLCAVFPAWRAAATPPDAVLQRGRGVAPMKPTNRLLSALVVGEIALALALLTGAGLLALHLRRLERRKLGLDPRHALVLRVTLPSARYPSGADRARATDKILAEVRATTGVQSAGVTTVNPLAGGTWVTPVTAEAGAIDARGGFPANYRLVSPDLFRAMGTARIDGRDFDARDRDGATPVAIVSRGLASRFWPGRSALGQRLRFAGPAQTSWRMVVGVVEDVADAGDTKDTWYVPYAQAASSAGAEDLYVIVRSSASAGSLAGALRAGISREDSDLAAYGIATMDRIVANSLARERFGASIAGISALAGLALAALGVAGISAYRMAQRRAEIAIRLALGGQRRQVVSELVREGGRLVLAGLAIGVAAALAEQRVLRHLVADIEAAPPAVIAGIALILAAAALAAMAVPAVRATRIEPLASLKGE